MKHDFHFEPIIYCFSLKVGGQLYLSGSLEMICYPRNSVWWMKHFSWHPFFEKAPGELKSPIPGWAPSGVRSTDINPLQLFSIFPLFPGATVLWKEINLFSFQPCHAAHGILVSWPGIETGPSKVKVQRPNTGPPGNSPNQSFRR